LPVDTQIARQDISMPGNTSLACCKLAGISYDPALVDESGAESVSDSLYLICTLIVTAVALQSLLLPMPIFSYP